MSAETSKKTKVGLGIEIDGSFTGVAAVDEYGVQTEMVIVEENNLDRDPTELLAKVGALAKEVAAECEAAGKTVVGAGLSVPGLVNSRTGVVVLSPNLGWEEVYPGPLLGLGDLPVTIGNDAKLAAIAELQVCPVNSFFYLMIGVGIGGAVVSHGRLYRGQHGWDSEIGHVMVDPDGPLCACGNRGCLEQYAAKPAMFSAAGLEEDAPVSEFVRRLKAGDWPTLQAFEQGATALGIVLANVINVLDLRTVIANGELLPIMPWVKGRFERRVSERILAGGAEQLTLRAAEAGPHPSLLGAGQLGLKGY